MRGLVLLLAIAACAETGGDRGAYAAPAEPSTARSGPAPQFSAEYEAPFKPFTGCAVRLLSFRLTVKVAYDESGRLAQLAAFDTKLDGRFIYELALRQKTDDVVLAELRVGTFSTLRNWPGEVRRALESCEQEL